MNDNKIKNSIIIYEGKNGTKVELNFKEDTMWTTAEKMALIFDCSVDNIYYHTNNILKDNELTEESSVKGVRNKEYNLDMIIAVGYRVNSTKATQFRIWATKILKEYIIKGFAMDDERLKNPSTNQYFDELLARIREIRASEKLFYQKVKDLYTTAVDYQEKKSLKEVQDFFKCIQNKMLYAVTGKTAPELIVSRIDENNDNLGLTNWKGSKVRKEDIDIAKNYCKHDEIQKLNRLTMIILEFGELQIENKKIMYLKDWEKKINEILTLNDYSVLSNAGEVSNDKMKLFADDKYKIFDEKRKEVEKEQAQQEAMEDLKEIEKEITKEIKKKNNTKKQEQ